MDQINLDELIDIAFSVEEGDPIDWGMFCQGKEESMKMIGASIIEQFDKPEYNYDDKMILLSTITKLVVENMILHTKLLQIYRK